MAETIDPGLMDPHGTVDHDTGRAKIHLEEPRGQFNSGKDPEQEATDTREVPNLAEPPVKPDVAA